MGYLLYHLGLYNQQRYVTLELEGEVPEDEKKPLIPFVMEQKKLSLPKLELILHEAETNPSVQGIVVKIRDLKTGLARANLIRTRLEAVGRAGKHVYAYLESGGNIEYMIASAANVIISPPWCTLNLIGLKAEVTLLKNLLSKLGIEAEFKALGKYKSAAETYTADSISKAHKEMLDSILDDLYDQFIGYISSGRGITPKSMRGLIDQGPYVAEKAASKGLIDEVGYESDIEAIIEKRSLQDPVFVGAEFYASKISMRNLLPSILNKLWIGPGMIAIISETGTITSGKRRDGKQYSTIGSASLIAELKNLSQRRDLRGVVLRILSPGGSGLASDLIRNELCALSEKVPVVISMSDVAASGGYLISLGSKTIVADPMTLTGSIGVIAGKLNVSGLLQKAEIKKEMIPRGKNALIYSPNKKLSDSEDDKLEEMIQTYYKQFVTTVSGARNISYDATDKLAQGRVWTGAQAKQNGLVDTHGGIVEALNLVRELAQIPTHSHPVIKFLSKPPWIRINPLFGFTTTLSKLEEIVEYTQTLNRDKILALMPFQIKID